MAKIAKPADGGDAEKRMETIRDLQKLPAIAKSKGGRKKRPYNKDLELTKTDLQILNTLLATGGNKELTARIEGIDRQKLYRLLNSQRVQKLTENAMLRLQSLIELCVLIMEHDLVQNANSDLAYKILRGLGILKFAGSKKDTPLPPGGKRATFEAFMDDDGTTHRRQTIEEAE